MELGSKLRGGRKEAEAEPQGEADEAGSRKGLTDEGKGSGSRTDRRRKIREGLERGNNLKTEVEEPVRFETEEDRKV